MPSEITAPVPAVSINRLTLSTECIRGAEGATGVIAAYGLCFADDAE